ncbi:sensor histidine kinase [Pseudotenacibaculum sp. MALMAid0570]|uniref:sensor histidine kinase n=1 Tax=Pseudotenacibaculum sp. MALMAid0570 TaxID=3143938 RepID=UPI0032DFBCBF
MKIKHIVTVIALLWSVFSFGQAKTVYFQKIIDTTSNKTLKLSSIDSLIQIYKKDHNDLLHAEYAEKYITLALKLEKYESAIEAGIHVFYTINTRLGQRERALTIIRKLEKFIDKTNDSYLKGGLYLKKGGGYFNGKDFEKAIDYYSLAINLYSDKDSIHKADAIFFRGQAHFEIGDFLKSVNDYKLASKYYETLGDKEYTFYTLASIISIYGANGFTEKAIIEREKLIQKKLDLNFLHGLSVDYYNHYASYKKTNNKEKQKENLLKALEYSLKNKNVQKNRVSIYAALSKFYSSIDLNKSKQYLDDAEQLVLQEDKNTISYKRYQLAKAYYLSKTGQKNKAISIYTASLRDQEKFKNSSSILDINRSLSEIYLEKGDHKKALEHHTTYTNIKDSIFNRTKTNALAYYQTLYETEKKEAEIQKQKNDIDFLAAQNENKRRLIIFGGIGLFLTFLIILLYRNRKHLQKKNQLQTHFSQNLLMSQDLERKRISKDLHDSLGQSLLIVKNKIPQENNDAKELLNNAIEEMRSISRVLYPLQLKELGITSAIHNLLEQLDENYPDTYIFGDVDNIDGILSNEQELNLFRVIQECLSNIIKHAKAKSAKLQVEKDENQIVMTLQDNGVGFDFLTKFKNLKSLGLKTIKERVRYLNGVLKVESSPGSGSVFKIIIQTT